MNKFNYLITLITLQKVNLLSAAIDCTLLLRCLLYSSRRHTFLDSASRMWKHLKAPSLCRGSFRGRKEMSCIARSSGTYKVRTAHRGWLVSQRTPERFLTSKDPLLWVWVAFGVLRDFASSLEVFAIVVRYMATCHDQIQQLCHLVGTPLQLALKLHKCKQHVASWKHQNA